MKIMRIVCLLLVSLMAISPIGSVLAQEEEEEPEYILVVTPYYDRYNITIMAGSDREFTVKVENLGTAAINNITFSTDKPKGWTIEFSPDIVRTLDAFDSQRVEVSIAPPLGTAAGDYMIALGASGEQASAEKIDIRVTVTQVVKEEKVGVSPTYPTLEAIAGEDFVFEVEFEYAGATLAAEERDFNLRTTAPTGWEVYMTPPYEKEKKVSAITLKPTFTPGNKLRVVASAPFWPLPEPGEYKITVEIISPDGKLKDSVELTAIITAKYILILAPSGERYNTAATAGKDNYFSIEAGNLGTAAIDKITFSSDKPEGWTIEFTPDKVDSLGAFDSQTIDVNIKPPSETIAGDYSITIKAPGKQVTARELNIRVTVESPTIWGWVGVGIILLVIAGLVVIFMRFSRR